MLLPPGPFSRSPSRRKLQAEAQYRRRVLRLPSTDPGYVRIDSQLMVAFDGIPVLEKPTGALAGPSRVFELRTYESHNKAAHRKKTEMFNKGEIDIFRRTGLQPVFFGSNIIGTRLPSLTYLLVFEDMAAREKNWPQFVGHPDWKTGGTRVPDAEIVSNTHSTFCDQRVLAIYGLVAITRHGYTKTYKDIRLDTPRNTPWSPCLCFSV